MHFNKYAVTKFEVDNRMFIYDNDMSSVNFSNKKGGDKNDNN